MVVDPVGATLGGASAFKLIVDSCRSLYDACQAMRSYGKDFKLYSLELTALQATFVPLMSNHADDLKEPPDLENPDYEFTRAIYHYLIAYQTHLEECHKIMSQTLEASQNVRVDTLREPPKPSDAPSPAAQPTRRKRDSLFGLIRKAASSRRPKKSGRDGVHANGDRTNTPRDSDAKTNVNTQAPGATSSRQLPRAISRQDEESCRIRTNPSPWKIIKWADHQKSDMNGALRKLRTSIDDLSRYMSLRPLSLAGVQRNLGVQQHVSYTPRFDPSVLASIHHSLTVINRDRAQTFGVSIADTGIYNHETLKSWLSGGQDKLRPDSLVLFVQKSDQQQDQSRLLAIEAGTPSDGATSHTGRNIIGDVAALTPPEITGNEASSPLYALCGAVEDRAGDQSSHHRIFIDRQIWEPGMSLSTHLDNPTFAARRLTTRSLIKIFCHIIIAYLDFQRIRGPCLHPRLEDYLTFRPPNYQDQEENVDAQATDHESLWWSCGFGRPALHRFPGSSRPPEEERGVALLELGLVLHQLGSGSKRVFESAPAPSGRTERDRWSAQGRALASLKRLSDNHGLPFMHAVQALLMGDDHDEAEEGEIVCASLASLENLSAELRRPRRAVASR